MFKNYFKIAFRNLIKHKVYGVLNIMGLALSITCGILIFSLVKHHLSFDNFHANSNRIYRFVTEQHRDNISYAASVPPAFASAFRKDYPVGEEVARLVTFNNEQVSIEAGNEVKKFKEPGGFAFAEDGYFSIFNFPLLQGQLLQEPNTAVITERMARKYFGEENPMNKMIRVGNKVDCRITGLLKDLPRNTDQKAEIFISWPSLPQYNKWLSRDDAWGGITSSLQCFVRLRPNISPAYVENLLPPYVKKFRPTFKNVHHYKLQPLADIHFDGRYGGVMEKRNLWILSFIGIFLLITACVNFINLATAQALRRSREVGVRKVLGSLRRTLFWQFITETGIITVTATVVAIGLSYLLLPYVNEWFKTQVSINVLGDWQLLSFICLLVVLVTFLAGSYPGLVLSRFRPVVALKGKLSMQNIGGFNTRRTLIIAQFTISLILIIGMVVITQQMRYAQKADLGFNKDAVVMIPVGADSAGPSINTLKSQLSAVPGVEKVSLCYAAPASEESWNTGIRFDSRPEEELFKVSMKAGDDQYMPVFGLQLVAGRNIFPSDTVREFLINETLARKLNLKSPQEAIGKKISFDGGNISATIAGVLKDFHDRSFHEEINAVAITTYSEDYASYAVKIKLNDVKGTLAGLEKTWSSIYPQKIYEYQFLDEHIAEFYETEETMLQLISAFSLVAILIGCLGLYGLVLFMVAQKTKEIGIRKVLGSSVGEMLWIFGKEFSRLLLIAFVIAAPVAGWLMHTWLQDFKYHIQIGPWVFVTAMALMLTVAAVTVAYQCIRAALMNPIKSLRSE